ncbi:MAG: type IV secretory system conjugative DNA transfer family protein, partial [Acidimicrobiales bacterium]
QDKFPLVAILGTAGITGLLWSAGWTSAHLSGHPTPPGGAIAALAAFGHMGDPSKAWHGSVGPAFLYWLVTIVFIATPCAFAWATWRLFTGGFSTGGFGSTGSKQNQHDGTATRREVTAAAGKRALLARAKTLRPSLTHPRPEDVGYRLGTSRRVACWASIEDSMLLLGPPRAGKGLHLVIPMILDAPGAVVTTSTRPDNLAVTIAHRAKKGEVAVFDPQRLAPAGERIPTMRWSPIRGCERPQTAMLRAAALGQGGTGGVESGAFWRQQSQIVIRCLLHAAAIAGKTPADLYRWSHAASGAKEAVSILGSDPTATPGWAHALDAIISADQRTRDSVWAMVANAFASLADPAVLAAVSPEPGDEFTPTSFIEERGTLYLLGTASGSSATANLVAALIEDVVDTAKRLAARSPRARLDPPLALILDEAANYPLPSLPTLMSEGGGSGITTLAVLQSLSQARGTWGKEPAGAMWDSAIVKILLGGSANADDLGDISRLIGELEYQATSVTRGSGSEATMSTSTSTRTKPILAPSDIRRLRFGHGLLLLRSAQPIMLRLSPWTRRRDRKDLQAARELFERAMQEGAQTDA